MSYVHHHLHDRTPGHCSALCSSLPSGDTPTGGLGHLFVTSTPIRSATCTPRAQTRVNVNKGQSRRLASLILFYPRKKSYFLSSKNCTSVWQIYACRYTLYLDSYPESLVPVPSGLFFRPWQIGLTGPQMYPSIPSSE